jgi:hypothetical protein
MYTYVSKCKNDKIKGERKKKKGGARNEAAGPYNVITTSDKINL